MPEMLIAGGVVLALLALQVGADRADPETLLRVSAVLVGAGLVFGLPASLVYHLRLRRALVAERRLEPRWWLRPTSYHASLDSSERSRVLTWFRVGAAGFTLAAAGAGVLFILASHPAL